MPAMSAAPWTGELPERVKARFGGGVLDSATYLGQNFLVLTPETVFDGLHFLKNEASFDVLTDVTAVDWPKDEARFELVYILYSHRSNERVRIKTRLRDGERARSAAGLFASANWLEREIFDLFGIQFIGHPNLKRILLPDGWEGHPLRKEYPIAKEDAAWVKANLGIGVPE
jgi:NADH-quinone oxidoreductase subunit C